VGVVLVVAALTTAACSATPSATTTTTTSSVVPRTSVATPSPSGTSAPVTSVLAHPVTTPTPPAGGPVPNGFDALSFTAVSTDEFWLLGTAPCPNPVCTSIIRTTDGGARFVGIHAPPAPLVSTGSAPTPGLINTLRFADPLDGYAVGVDEPGSDGFWVTHDGGEHWSALAFGHIEAFDISDGEAYAVVGICGNDGCDDIHLERSAAGTNTWTPTPLPVISNSPEASLSAQGDNIWIDAQSASGTGEVLEHSADDGISFSSGPSPCVAGLGGTVEAVPDNVLWFVCPTGMMAVAERSIDDGARFERLNTGEIVNASEIAAADTTTAVLVSGDSPALRRTADSGGSFQTVFSPAGSSGWFYVGFTTPSVGVGLSMTSSSGSAPSGSVTATTLWRTVDGGLSWLPVTY
jgi:hypothetical protein